MVLGSNKRVVKNFCVKKWPRAEVKEIERNDHIYRILQKRQFLKSVLCEVQFKFWSFKCLN